MLTTAVIQFDSKPGKVRENLERATTMIEKAKEEGAELVVLPELFNVGYDFNILPYLDYDYEETKSFLSQTARELDINIAAGVLEVEAGNWYNSVVVFDQQGTSSALYRKISLFPLSGEQELFKQGNSLATFSIGNFKLGIMICFDIRFPEISREYLKQDCDGLIIASAFPLPRLDHWRELLKAMAIQNQMYIIAANRTGRDDIIQFLGNSCIIDPWGTVKAATNVTEETIVSHGIDLRKVFEVRKTMPCQENFKCLTELFQ